MKTKLLLILCLFINAIDFQAQSLKKQKIKFKYEVLPATPLPENIRFYDVETSSNAKDGIPLNEIFNHLSYNYIKGLINLTPNPNAVTKEGFYMGGLTIGFNTEKKVPLTPADKPQLKISLIFSDIELIKKTINEIEIENSANPKLPFIYKSYKLTFKFPFHLKVTDLQTGKQLVDTILVEEKTTLFPNEYNVTSQGQRTTPYGYLSMAELDLDYNKSNVNLYPTSKNILAQKSVNWMNSYLNQKYGFSESSHSWALSYVKAKNPIYAVSDTVINSLKSICDTIESNTENKNHLNWHCKYVKEKLPKIISVYEKFISDDIYTNGFKDIEEREDFIIQTKKNLIVAFLFNDEFEKANNLFNQIEASTIKKYINSEVQDETMKQIKSFIKRETFFYTIHKNRFNFR